MTVTSLDWRSLYGMRDWVFHQTTDTSCPREFASLNIDPDGIEHPNLCREAITAVLDLAINRSWDHEAIRAIPRLAQTLDTIRSAMDTIATIVDDLRSRAVDIADDTNGDDYGITTCADHIARQLERINEAGITP